MEGVPTYYLSYEKSQSNVNRDAKIQLTHMQSSLSLCTVSGPLDMVSQQCYHIALTAAYTFRCLLSHLCCIKLLDHRLSAQYITQIKCKRQFLFTGCDWYSIKQIGSKPCECLASKKTTFLVLLIRHACQIYKVPRECMYIFTVGTSFCWSQPYVTSLQGLSERKVKGWMEAPTSAYYVL